MSKLKQGGTLYIVIGAVLAVVAAAMFYAYASRPQPAPATPPPTVAQTKSEVLVAAKDIAAYSIVNPEMLKKELVDKDKVKADDAFEDSQVLGKMTSASLKAGQRVSLTQLTSASFSYTVPQGLRGLALQVDELSTLGGLIEDGDFVDVLYSGAEDAAASQPAQNGAPSTTTTQAKYTKTVLEDVQILKVIRAVQPSAAKDGQANQAQQQAQQATPAGMVIVAVTDQQAEVVKFTRENGSLHLVLRAKNDHAIEETTGVTNKVLKEKYGVPAP